MAHFSWMGGSHDCGGPADHRTLTVSFPERAPEYRVACGNYLRQRVVQEIIVDGGELAHLLRFMERVIDDGEVEELSVVVRAGGTIEFYAQPFTFIYSAAVGHRDPDWEPEEW